MPPKKKKGSGKGKGGSGPSSAKVGGGGAGENLSALSKEFFLIQISDLEDRLARYQRKCDEVEIANSEFHKQYDQLQVDKRDIVQFLKKQLDSKADEVADLTDRLRGLQQAKDAEKEAFESQLAHVRAEFTEKKEHLTSENILLGGKLAGLEEFKVQKDQLMNKFGDMEDEMAKKEETFKDEVYGLERKNVIDKDRLKKEMVQRVNQVAAEFRKVSNKQMADTTKRTIRENVAIHVQLAKMSDKTMQLIKENDELVKQLKEAKRKIGLQEDIEKDLAKKNHSNQKVIQLLTARCQLMETHLGELEAHEADYQEMQSELQELQKDFETGKDDVEEVTMQRNNLQEENSSLLKKVEEEKELKSGLERIIFGAADALNKVLSGEMEFPLPAATTATATTATTAATAESPTQRPNPEGSEKEAPLPAKTLDGNSTSSSTQAKTTGVTATSSKDAAAASSPREVFVGKEKPGFFTEEEKRHLMLTHLLGILNAAADLGVGGAGGVGGGGGGETGAGDKKSRREATRQRRSASPQFRPGDAGLVSGAAAAASQTPATAAGVSFPAEAPIGAAVASHRKPMTHAQKLERLRILSPTSRLGKIKLLKPATRSVATQTASAPRAVFYAEQLLEHGGPVAHTRDGPVKLPPPGHPPHPLARSGPPPRQHLAPLAPIAGKRRAEVN